jgi:hypothetical protein
MPRKSRSKKRANDVELGSEDSYVDEDSIAVSLPHGPLDPYKDSEKSKAKSSKKEKTKSQQGFSFKPQSIITFVHNLIQQQKNINNIQNTLQA